MKKIIILSLLSIFGVLFFSSCNKDRSKNGDISEITVMIPDWAVPSDEMLESFTDETGIKVNINVVAWDNIRDKISIASAGGSAAADVVEVDWSWVGEFNSAGWLEPIDISKEDMDSMPSIGSFIAGGNVLALPYANDFRIAYYNKELFKRAGIETVPETWAEVYNYMKIIKEKAIVKYPFSMPLNADESTTTSLIWMALSKYGVVFNDDGTLNQEAIEGTLEFIDDMVNQDKLIDPANKTSSGMDAYRKLTAGEASFIVGPTSFVSRINDEKESKVVGEVVPILLPGATGPSPKTFALPEGLGVTRFSKNKEAAMRFIKWFNSPNTQKELNYVQNTMPTRTVVLEDLILSGKLKNTGALLEESKLIVSPFPGGVPDYYPEMSAAIFNSVNEMVIGNKTPTQAFEEMNGKIKALIKDN